MSFFTNLLSRCFATPQPPIIIRSVNITGEINYDCSDEEFEEGITRAVKEALPATSTHTDAIKICHGQVYVHLTKESENVIWLHFNTACITEGFIESPLERIQGIFDKYSQEVKFTNSPLDRDPNAIRLSSI